MKKNILLSLVLSGFLCQAQNANPLKEKVYYSVSEALDSDKKATQLNLRDQHIFYVEENISQLKNLRFLNLMRNNLEKWDDAIFELKKLEVLILKLNSMKYVPKDIGEFEKLIRLDLSNDDVPYGRYPAKSRVRMGISMGRKGDRKVERFRGMWFPGCVECGGRSYY